MEGFQDIEHFVKSLYAAIKKKIPTKVSQLTNDAGYKTTDTNTTYKLSKSGSTVTLTGSDGSATSVTDSNTTYSSLKNPYSLTIQNNGTTVESYDGSTSKTVNLTNATASSAGLMSASDKVKLDGITSLNAETLAKLYPVGSIYLSVNDTNPGTFIGGTWERIKDRFLLAAGDAYAAGSTGGEAQHTLTVDEMPAHEHSVRVRVQGYDGWESYTSLDYGVMFKANDTIGYHLPNYTAHSTVVGNDSNTYGSGGSQPHNNMPPYLAVYIWKRVS